MNDAFDALRADTAPLAPSPTFAARLRTELLTTMEAPMPATATATHIHTHTSTVTAYLVVGGAAAAIDFYVAAFGAVERHRLVGDDGRIGHAEIVIGDTLLSLADEHPEYDSVGPLARGGTSVHFTVVVDDVDTVFARALRLGATELRPVADQFYGRRQGTLRDPWGHQWGIGTPLPGFDDAQYAANSRELGFQLQPADRDADPTDPSDG